MSSKDEETLGHKAPRNAVSIHLWISEYSSKVVCCSSTVDRHRKLCRMCCTNTGVLRAVATGGANFGGIYVASMTCLKRAAARSLTTQATADVESCVRYRVRSKGRHSARTVCSRYVRCICTCRYVLVWDSERLVRGSAMCECGEVSEPLAARQKAVSA